ncbi:hypothetical protein CRG98_016673 [Punica granatum]|uniref:Uncharacterized protein n=1 Tax=Punica granatum TaxID=22663 RepID=A0A2I0K311_PUNGR|nr:hypothetical protein CRG98_016673 [Punica granatum]
MQEARGRWLGELAAQESCKRHERGGSANLRRRKVSSHGLENLARLQEARARWLGELAVQEMKLARVSRLGKVARGTSEVALRTCGAGKHERGGSANLRCKKVNSNGLVDPARLQEARARWLGELAVWESKLARVSGPGKVARGTSVAARRTYVARNHERGGSANLRCWKERSHGLADPARLQEARARWLGELARQENLARLQEARARWLYELAVQESKLVRVSTPGKTRQGCNRHERGGSANLRCRKVSSHGLADPARLQEARARWLGELAVLESNLSRVSRPGKVATGMSVVARRTCDVGKLTDPARLHEARARWLGELAVQEMKLALVSILGKVARSTGETRQGCKKHGRGGSANLRGRKVKSHGLAYSGRLQGARTWWLKELAVWENLTRLQEARARWLYELAVQESKLVRVSRPGKVERGTSEVALRTCGAGKHERGGSANFRCWKERSHGLADPARLQEARARWLGELAVQEMKLARVSRLDKVARGTSEVARRTCEAGKKVSSHGFENLARVQEAGARWLDELARQESKIARVSGPGKVARGRSEVARRTCSARNETRSGCKRHERGGWANLRCKKVNSNGLVDPARLQEARARWLGELAVEEMKLARVSDLARLQEARARWLGELAVEEMKLARVSDLARLQEARARCLYELAVQESQLIRVSRPGKVGRGTSEVARRTCGAGKKVSSHGFENPTRLQEARARWLGELVVQKSKHARVSRPGKFARGTNETRQDCKRHEGGGSANLRGRKVKSHGLADPARLQEARGRWLGELAAQESKLARVSRSGKVARSTGEVARRTCEESKLARVSGPGKVARGTSEVARRTCEVGKKVSSHGLANLARLQEARARWLGELAVQESKVARVSRLGKVARGTSERHERGGSANLRCKKVNSNGLADPAMLQEARARWLGELAVQEMKLARVSRPGKVARSMGEVARRTCEAGKKISSHGLADPARLPEARSRWLGELAVQEMNLARVSRRGKVSRGTSEVARRTCGAGKKVSSHGLADPAKLHETRARWLGELAMQERKLERVSRPRKVARGTSEVARRTCGTRQGSKGHERGGSMNMRWGKVSSHGLAHLERLQEARARWLGELAVPESKVARVSRPGKVARGTSEVARRTCEAGKKVSSHGLADPARLQEARARWLGELAVQEMKFARTRQGCKGHERGGPMNLRCRKVSSHGLANLARSQEARARWLDELAVQETKLARVSRLGKVARATSEVALRACGAGKHERGGSANLRCKKVNSNGLADPARLPDARARWLGELAVQEMTFARVSRPGKVARGTSEVARRTSGCKGHERGGSMNLRRKKVSSHGLANLARSQEARARWLGELVVQEMKLARVSIPGKVAKGLSVVARRTCGARKYERGGSANFRCKKVNSNWLADPERLQEARARWLGELAAQEMNFAWESKLARVSRSGKVARSTGEVARRTFEQTWQGCKRHERGGSANLRCKKVSSHGLADPARLQEARARWLGELAVQEMKLARVSRLGKVARGTSEVALRTCGAGKKVSSHGLADPARWQEARARWLGEVAVQESKLARVSRSGKGARSTGEVVRRTCEAGKKISSHGLADLARLQEARARWLGELQVQESKLARVSRSGKGARSTGEVVRRTCEAGKKISSHGLADLARLQEARARWLGELQVQESKLARVSRSGKGARSTGEVVRRTCEAGKKISSHGLADLARLQEARARWLGELQVQESKLARVSRSGKGARSTGEVVRRTCEAGKKISSHGLADLARLQEARARWLGELQVQESKLARVSRSGKGARSTGEVVRRTCEAGKKISSHGLADLARLQEARARWLGELQVQESKLARVSRSGKGARSTGEVVRRTCEAGKKISSHGLADLARLQEARARWLGELQVQESKLARVSRSGKGARSTGEVVRRTCEAGKKVKSYGLADSARLQGARAWKLNELAAQESKLAGVSKPDKVARDTSETWQGCKWHERGGSANLRCKKVISHGLADPATLQKAGCKRHERGGSANLRCKKVNSNGLADPARLQVARARWLGELAVQESNLPRVSRPGKVAKGRCVVARRTCGVGKHERGGSANFRCKKVNSNWLADPARLQVARARWLGELAVKENKLARVSGLGKTRQGCKKHGRGGSANLRCKKVNSNGLADPARLQEARARWLDELAKQESKIARTRQGCKKHGRGGSANLRCKKVVSHGLADPARLQEARARWLGELAVQESSLPRVSRPGKVARSTGETRQGCKKHGRGGSANLRCKKVVSHGLADPARLQEARARWLGELAVQESSLPRVSRPGKVARSTGETRQGCKKHGRGGSANLRCKKVVSHGLADPARLQEARARWLGELAVQESSLPRVSRPGKVARSTGETRQGCKKHGRGGSANLRCKKVVSHGLADPARLQEARARWLGELAVQESSLPRVSRPGKVARSTGETRQGCKKHGRGGSANLRCKKVVSHGLADPARLQEARARWLGELAVQESSLPRVSRPGKVARSTGETRQGCKKHGRGGSANLRCKKVVSHGLADPARLQEARARWLGELAVQESSLPRVSRPGKVARSTGETRQGCKKHGRGGSANLRCKKVVSHGLADPARLQEARARWLGELAVQESSLPRVSRPGKVARSTGETRQGCKKHGRGGSANLRCKKVVSHGLADPARLQEARARWLGELAVQESSLPRVSRPGKVARSTGETRQGCKKHGRGGSANLRCKKVVSHGLADPARLQEARARWLGELAVQESSLPRVSRPGKVARSTGETRQGCKKHGRGGSANLRCKKVVSHGLADPARLQEARARWLGELAVQESSLPRVSRPGKVARSTGETRQGCKKHGRGGSANLRCKKVVSHGLADPARLQEARARWLGELAVQESSLPRVSRPGKVARGTSEVARRTCGARK